MARRLSVEDVLADAGYADVNEAMDDAEFMMDGMQPACCEEYCDVEPDGVCEHGHPSWMLVAGFV